MEELKKVDAPVIDCPICGEGKAALYEEVRTGQIAEPKPDGPVKASYVSRFRTCDHCGSDFAGQEESRYNLVQYKAALAEHGRLMFPEDRAA